MSVVCCSEQGDDWAPAGAMGFGQEREKDSGNTRKERTNERKEARRKRRKDEEKTIEIKKKKKNKIKKEGMKI